jgi:Mg/Co/Ni transporter MgtE
MTLLRWVSGYFIICGEYLAFSDAPTGKYLGLVHIQRLLREPPHASVGSILDKVKPLHPHTPIDAVHRRLAAYDLIAVPIVDEVGRLVGAVTVDDVLDHILPEDWREERDEVAHG